MTNMEKFVMVPQEKYRRLTASAPGHQERKATSESAKEEDEEPGMKKKEEMEAPPPGMPEKPTVRWLTLPETE